MCFLSVLFSEFLVIGALAQRLYKNACIEVDLLTFVCISYHSFPAEKNKVMLICLHFHIPFSKRRVLKDDFKSP